MSKPVIMPTPEKMIEHAKAMLSQAELMQKSDATKDVVRKAIIPRLQKINAAKVKMQRIHDQFIDASAELEQEVSHLEDALREAFP